MLSLSSISKYFMLSEPEYPATEWMIAAIMVDGAVSEDWCSPFRVLTHWRDENAIFETLNYYDGFDSAMRFPLDEAEIECELIQQRVGKDFFLFVTPIPTVTPGVWY